MTSSILPALRRSLLACALVAGASLSLPAQTAAAPAARNVVLVMTDGLRWQELVRGADASLLTPKHFYDDRNVDELKKEFLAPTPEERRRLLMSFVWNTLVPQGQLYGVPPVTQSQIAATLAQLLGKDWDAAEPKAGRPLPYTAPAK